MSAAMPEYRRRLAELVGTDPIDEAQSRPGESHHAHDMDDEQRLRRLRASWASLFERINKLPGIEATVLLAEVHRLVREAEGDPEAALMWHPG